MGRMRESSRPQGTADARSALNENQPNLVVIREHRAVFEFARTLSTIFNPFLCATALFVIMAHAYSSSTLHFWELSLTGLFFYALAPVLGVFYLYLSGRISDFDMSDRFERSRAFLTFVVVDLAAAIVLTLAHAAVQIVAVAWGYFFATAIIMIITRWWKISTHAFGITGPFAAMFLLFGLAPLPYVIVVPLVWWARVYLRAHTIAQVLAGATLAVASTLAVFRLFHLI
jgi:membrane-associated phospholipid phosphatase